MTTSITCLSIGALGFWLYTAINPTQVRDHMPEQQEPNAAPQTKSTPTFHSLPTRHNPSARKKEYQSSDTKPHNLPPMEEIFTMIEREDILFISSILEEMTEKIFSFEELKEYLLKHGFKPYSQRQGHKRTGFRRVISIEEKNQPERIIKEFYGSYHEYKGDLLFDRLYYGLEKKPLLFEHTLLEIDKKVKNSYIKRMIVDNYARWDFSDGTFIFIRADFLMNDEEMVLIGKEYEIH